MQEEKEQGEKKIENVNGIIIGDLVVQSNVKDVEDLAILSEKLLKKKSIKSYLLEKQLLDKKKRLGMT